MNGNSTSPSASSYFCQLGSIKSEHQVELEGRNWKAETENGACRCRGIGRDPGVAGDLSSSRLKLPHPTNHKFSDSLVLVVEPLVFAVCIAGSTDSLSTRPGPTPLDRVIGFGQPKPNVQRFGSLCFFRGIMPASPEKIPDQTGTHAGCVDTLCQRLLSARVISSSTEMDPPSPKRIVSCTAPPTGEAFCVFFMAPPPPARFLLLEQDACSFQETRREQNSIVTRHQSRPPFIDISSIAASSSLPQTGHPRRCDIPPGFMPAFPRYTLLVLCTIHHRYLGFINIHPNYLPILGIQAE